MAGSFRSRTSRELGCALPVGWDAVVGVVIGDLDDLSVCVKHLCLREQETQCTFSPLSILCLFSGIIFFKSPIALE